MKPIKLKFNFDDQGEPTDVKTKQELLSRILEGKWISQFKGRGMEFAEYRNYVYGDDASSIDWKATLRSGITLIKIYEQDKSAKVIFVFDTSDTMLFSSRNDGKMKAEYAAEFIVRLMKSILKSGDAVGLIMFTNKILKNIPPNIGIAMESKIKTELKNVKNYGGEFNFEEAMKNLLGFANDKYIFIIVSDFIGLKQNWHHYIEILNQRFDVIGIMIKDHRDRYLPDTGGQVVLQDPSTKEKIYVDSSQYSKLYHEKVVEEEEEIEKKFKAAKSTLLKIETTEDAFSKLIKFFRKREVLINQTT